MALSSSSCGSLAGGSGLEWAASRRGGASALASLAKAGLVDAHAPARRPTTRRVNCAPRVSVAHLEEMNAEVAAVEAAAAAAVGRS